MDEISQLVAAMQDKLPREVVLVGGKIDVQPPAIDEAEWKLVDRASRKRQCEFSSGRYYAHQALEKLGLPHQAIGRDDKGAPQWPDGISGSISHTDHYCTVLLAEQNTLQSVGIDLEESGRMKPNLWSRLLTKKEIDYLHSIHDVSEQTRQAASMFSAKEAFYKCDYPLYRQQIDFRQVDLEIQANHELGISFSRLDRDRRYTGLHVNGMTHVMTVVLCR